MKKAPSGASCEMRTRIASSGLVKLGVHSRGAVNWCQARAGSGGSQGFPAMALLMASSVVMPWAAAESR